MGEIKRKIIFVVNDPDFFLSHRLPIAMAAREAGYTVHVATGSGKGVAKIKSAGFTHHGVTLSRSGKNPLHELQSIFSLHRLMRRVRPAIVHLVTIKPVLYGGLAARLAGVPAVVAAVSGLGTVFVAQGVAARTLHRLVQVFYKMAFAHRNLKAIFQNPDDRAALLAFQAADPANTTTISGSGVDLAAYPLTPEPAEPVVVSFAARLLKEKGVEEFVQAARLLHERGCQARFWLIGDPDRCCADCAGRTLITQVGFVQREEKGAS